MNYILMEVPSIPLFQMAANPATLLNFELERLILHQSADRSCISFMFLVTGNSCWLTYSQCVKGQVLVERELAGPGCPAFCSMVFAPVTGPDGKEYSKSIILDTSISFA